MMHNRHDVVYKFLKLVLVLSAATASVEKIFTPFVASSCFSLTPSHHTKLAPGSSHQPASSTFLSQQISTSHSTASRVAVNYVKNKLRYKMGVLVSAVTLPRVTTIHMQPPGFFFVLQNWQRFLI
jgi:hypothetical protein